MEVKAKGKDPNSEDHKETGDQKLGGNIVLSGFSLESIEMIVIRKIVGTYAKKISEKIDYQELKVTLKTTRKQKMSLHEVHVQIKAEKEIESNAEHKNLYTALSEALDKAYEQAESKEK
tara:strand:- start:265 stop:621 length:357 start_codon:yes stop_codon:yes gene_type:complete